MTSASRTTPKRLTAKQRVLKRYPRAVAANYVNASGPHAGEWWWAIENGMYEIGNGDTAPQAWADAARRLK